MLGISHPDIGIYEPSDPAKTIVETISADAPDQIFLQGKFMSGALMSFHMEGGMPFPGEPGLRWHIVGSKGELMITNPVVLMDVMHKGAKILFSARGENPFTDKSIFSGQQAKPATEIQVKRDELAELPGPSQNVGRLYEAFADGKTDMYADWVVGLRRHELMEELVQRWDGKKPFGDKSEYMRRT